MKGTCSYNAARDATRKWVAENPTYMDSRRAKYRANYLAGDYKKHELSKKLKRYALTEERYAEIVKNHNGKCGLCDKPPGAKGLQIDHSHRFGHVRGLLCMTCNTRLGQIESEWFIRAMLYLGKTEHTYQKTNTITVSSDGEMKLFTPRETK